MKDKLKIGAHSSIAFGFENSVKSIYFMGGNSVQIFLKSPRSRKAKILDKIDALNTKNFVLQNNIFLVGHCSYLLNFAKPKGENFYALNSILEDLEYISKLGGKGVVLHIGKFLKLSKDEALVNIQENLNFILKEKPKDVKIFLENTAGQGTEIGYKIDCLKEIYDNQVLKDEIEFCIDTAHLFGAGYCIDKIKGVENFFREFDKKIGIEKIALIHFNDSKKECGSRVDRHQDIGYGKIGIEGLKEVAKKAYENSIPLILETPCEFEDYKTQIEKIKSWFD